MQELTKDYILDCYQNIKLVHTSERSEIWLVEHCLTQKLFIKRTIPFSESCLKVFERLKTIKHPNIIQIIEVIDYDQKLVVIEEYIEGKSLSDLIQDKKLFHDKDVINIMKQLCLSLDLLHANNIVHRDIKPANIMVCESGIIKLIDFDTARVFNAGSGKDTKLLGTEGYASPEQFGYAQSDPRADIYALGVTIYELLTGELPKSDLKYNGELKRIIKKCMQFDPCKRFQSVKDLERSIDYLWYRKKVLALFASIVILATFFMVWSFFGPENSETQSTHTQLTEAAVTIETPIESGDPINIDAKESSTVGVEKLTSVAGVESEVTKKEKTEKEDLSDSSLNVEPSLREDIGKNNANEESEFPALADVSTDEDGFNQLIDNEDIKAAIKDAAGDRYNVFMSDYITSPGTIVYDKDLSLYYGGSANFAIEFWQDGTVRIAYLDLLRYQVIHCTNNSDKACSTYMGDWINKANKTIESLVKIDNFSSPEMDSMMN